MEDSIFSEGKREKRSTLLTVLCILSFIGGGYAIINGAFALSPAGQKNLQTVQDKIKKDTTGMDKDIRENKRGDNKLALKMMNASREMADPVKIRQSSISSIVCSLFTLVGAILMFRRNRIGFPLYVLGCVAGIGAVIYIYGTDNFFSKIAVGVNVLISIVFIVLYAMCLKEMNPPSKSVV